MSHPTSTEPAPPRHYSPLAQLILARLREFYREPETVFWVYGFPILMSLALGIAFRNKPIERITVDVQDVPAATRVAQALSTDERFVVTVLDEESCRRRLRSGKSDVLVIPDTADGFRFLYDPTRPESALARYAANDALQRGSGRSDPLPVQVEELHESGNRYIDFLIPGLLGMSLMGGGLWGVGFVIVDMRIRKLLKRLLATPMKKGHFLAAIMISRLCFMVPEVLLILLFSRLAFGVVNHGSLLALLMLILLGAFTFSGIGLLVASRARTLEAVSGLMNLTMLPMWVLSGIFFSSERFPDVAQPFIKLLPLTAQIDAMRAIMLEGEPLTAQLVRMAILAAWALVTFVLALRWFRWN